VFQMATKCSKFSALKGIAEAKKKRNRPEVGLRVRGRGIRNVAELAAAEIKGMGLSAVERTGTAAAEDNRRHGHDRCPSKWRERGRGYERWR
jgi:hypothetical protein